MYALVTGASSGIGRDIARLLAKKNYDLILVARNREALTELKSELVSDTGVKVVSVPMDLSKRKNCIKLYYMVSHLPVEVLVNNAGFGTFGDFYKTDISDELDMINVNICAVHILTKLFLRKMMRANRGYILNVASLAAFTPGPLMSTYYATKAYVLRLTEAVNAEVKHKGRNVSVSAFCPGPVDTDFNRRAGVSFAINPIDSKFAAYKAVKGMFDKKCVIFPGWKYGVVARLARKAPQSLAAEVCYRIQTKKIKS
jgi:hypothetical protein